MFTLLFVTVYVLWRCTLCDVHVLKTLCFGTLTLCAATFCNITSCDVYVMLLYVFKVGNMIRFKLFRKGLLFAANQIRYDAYFCKIIREICAQIFCLPSWAERPHPIGKYLLHWLKENATYRRQNKNFFFSCIFYLSVGHSQSSLTYVHTITDTTL